MNDTKTQNVCKHCGYEITFWQNTADEPYWTHVPNGKNFDHVAEPASNDQRCNIHRSAVTRPVSGDVPKTDIEKKYLIALRWFKLFYNFFQEDIKGKPSAAMSAMSEDSELQELLREADRIR